MAETQGGFRGGNHSGIREYRKGNWTFSETMILIEAKKMDDERRLRRSIGLTDQSDQQQSIIKNKPTELRWKWIEDYCWKKGCLRSQNQCNDKWDNLMRDYKKVREYERKGKVPEKEDGAVTTGATNSYWKMEKSERKEKNLPSNMLPQIYEALLEVIEKRGTASVGQTSGVNVSFSVDDQPQLVNLPPNLLQYHHHHHHQGVSAQVALPLSLPPPRQTQTQPQAQPLPTTCNSSDSDTSERSAESPAAKRRKKSTSTPTPTPTPAVANAEAAGTSGAQADYHNQLGAAITKSASSIAEALLACEERQDRRHRDLMSLQERRLNIEESKAEISRQGFSGLVDVINKLSNSIYALASSSSNTDQSRNLNENDNQSKPSADP